MTIMSTVAAISPLTGAVTPMPEKVTCATSDKQDFQQPYCLQLTRWLGSLIYANEKNRMVKIDTDRMLQTYRNRPGGSYNGEHIGKWLHAATMAWVNTCDAELRKKLDFTATELIKSLLTMKQVNKIATGKAYQLLSVLVGFSELARVTADREMLQAAEAVKASMACAARSGSVAAFPAMPLDERFRQPPNAHCMTLYPESNLYDNTCQKVTDYVFGGVQVHVGRDNKPGATGTGLVLVENPVSYADGRPYPSYRLNAVDQGKFLEYGKGPDQCDSMNAREALINFVDGTYYLYYDGAGPKGWVSCLAVSTDLKTWERKGPLLDFGPGWADSAAACSPWIIKDDNNLWHMFYLGTPNTTGGTQKIPIAPYLALHAMSSSPAGPWTKRYNPVPFSTKEGTYYSMSAYPGHILRQGNEYMMFFGAADAKVRRTISIARTKDLNGEWTVDPVPALPVTENIENSSIYYEPTNKTWFLFTNHIGDLCPDAIWVYWTKNINVWNPACKAIVLDGSNCTWSHKCIGMPSVVQVGDKLYVFYDAPGGYSTNEMGRSVGKATLQLPLKVLDPTALQIPVMNGSFETPGTTTGGPWAKFGSPWSTIEAPTNFQQLQVVTGDAFSSTVDGGGNWSALISTDGTPAAHPLVQNLPRNVSARDTLSVTFWLGRQKGTTGGQGVAYFDVGGTKYPITFDTTSLTADSWKSYTLTQKITNSGNLSLGFYGTTKAASWLDKISDVTVSQKIL